MKRGNNEGRKLTLRRLLAVACLAVCAVTAQACIGQKVESGYTFLQKEISDEALQGMSRRDVFTSLGSPSVVSRLDKEKWYYIANTSERTSIFAQKLKHQAVLELIFDEDGKVKVARRYNENDARDVKFATETTPTSGHSIGVAEQIFGNIGRFSTQEPDK